MSIPYYIIDVFSSTPYKGNPLAVVPTLDVSLTTTQMKLLARQFNLSETTFICPPTTAPATYRLRFFLPNGEEVFGVGHNALGAWWYLAHSGFLESDTDDKTGVYHQALGGVVFLVEVRITGSASSEPELESTSLPPPENKNPKTNKTTKIEISMRQNTPQFLSRHPDPSALAAALAIDPSEIGFHVPSRDEIFVSEPRVVTTSPARHLMVPVRDVHVLRRVRFASEVVAAELERTESRNSGVYVFAPVSGYCSGSNADNGAGAGTRSVDHEKNGLPRFEARFFSPGMGAEDPATGSAAGPLGVYVWENGVVSSESRRGSDVEVGVEVVQGRERGRECVIEVGLEVEEGRAVGVVIRGTGFLVAKGEAVVPGEEVEF